MRPASLAAALRPSGLAAALRPSSLAVGPLLVAAALALPAAAGAVVSSTPNPLVDSINNRILTVLRSGSRTFIGGSFTRIGIPTPNGAQVSLADGSSSAAFARPNDQVTAVASDGSGGWYIGGSFTQIGGVTRNHLAHLLPDGSVDAGFDPNVNGDVSALVVSSDRTTLYAGGAFTSVNGTGGDPGGNGAATPESGLAAFTTTRGPSLGVASAFNPNVGGTVSALALSPDGATLYAGGNFTAVNGTTGDPAGDGTTTPVGRLAAFTTSAGPKLGVATAFNPNISTANSGVTALAISADGTTLYAGGTFASVNGASGDTGGAGTASPRNGLAAFSTTAGATLGAATAFDPALNAGGTTGALSLSPDGSTLYVGGRFSSVNGAQGSDSGDGTSTARRNLAAFTTTAGADLGVVNNFDPSPEAPVRSLALSTDGATLYAAGDFQTVNDDSAAGNPTIRNHIAAFDTTAATNGGVTSFDPNVDAPVKAIALAGTASLYAGGLFEFVGADTVYNGLAAIRADGTVDPTFDPDVSGLIDPDNGSIGEGQVDALAASPDGGTIYAGGEFSSVNGLSTAYHSLAAFSTATGAVVAGFNPNLVGIDGAGHAITLAVSPDGSTIYAGGVFTKVNGSNAGHPNLAAFSATGATQGKVLAAFAGLPAIEVDTLLLEGAELYAGGVIDAGDLVAVDPTTGQIDTTFDPDPDGAVTALAVSGSTLYLGGPFDTVNVDSTPVTRNGVAAVNASTGLVLTGFDPDLGPPAADPTGFEALALALSPDDGTLYIGGTFTTVNAGVSGHAYLAAVDSGTGAVDPGFAPGANGQTDALVASRSDLYAVGVFSALGGDPRSGYADFPSAAAGPPAVVTGAASGVTASGASLAGTVNPNGVATTYVFEYGPTLSFGSVTTRTSAGSGATATPVSASLTGLASNTTYYYRLVAKTAAGETFGAVESFNTGGTPLAPAVSTLAASGIGTTVANLAGHVNPEGQATAFTFEYGPSLAFGSITTVDRTDAAIQPEAVTATLTGLTPNTTYYYRLVAANPAGTTFGGVVAFNTTGPPLAPAALTLPATSAGATTAGLAGSVNPEGRATAFTFEYGPSLAFGSITPVVELDNAIAAEPTSASLTGLTQNTTYYYRVVAANSAGTTTGVVRSFTTGPGGG
ncbi:MAG TPA: hypothetical protein VIJ51_10375 [Solirubrobacteraceae bacterium]